MSDSSRKNCYANGKIYTIRSNQRPEYYIGSTCNPLYKRFAQHKAEYKRFLLGKITKISSFEVIKYEDCYIELLENYACNSKEELNQREGERIREHKENCVNNNIAGRKRQQYYKDNKDKIKDKTNQYRDYNKDKIKQYIDDNKVRIRDQKKQYYIDNKVKIQDRMKQYHNDKRTYINENRRMKRIIKKLSKVHEYTKTITTTCNENYKFAMNLALE